MKKLFVCSLVLFALLLGACSLLQRQEPVPSAPPAEVQMERKTGVVSASVDEGVPNPDTLYVLVMDGGERMPVDSLLVNLKRYKKRRVEALGKWNDEKTIFMIEGVTSLQNETQEKKLFMNGTWGLKFQYPMLWDLKEQKNLNGINSITITPYEVDESELANVDVLSIERSENNRRSSPKDWLGLDDQYRSLSATDTAVYQQSMIGVGKLSAVKKTIGTGETIEFYVSRDTYIYKFSHHTVGDSDKDTYRNAFIDLIQSFEFVPFSKKAAASVSPQALKSPLSTPGALSVTPKTPVKKTQPQKKEPAPKPAEPPAAPPESTEPAAAPSPVAVAPKDGMTMLVLKMFKITIQYPKNWYWAYQNGGYAFSNKSVDETNVLVFLEKNPKADALLPSFQNIGKIGSFPAEEATVEGKTTLCIVAYESKYCVAGDTQYRSTMISILETLTAQE